MKKFSVFLCTLLLFLSLSGIASATLYYEEYRGYQNVWEGEAYNFGFDLWFDNSIFGVDTDSNLKLTQDAEGASGNYQSATLFIDFYSIDWQDEDVDITLTAWNDFGNNAGSVELDTFHWNGNWWNGTTQSFSYSLTPNELDLFDDWGWGNVTIAANIIIEDEHWWDRWEDNDFAITRVATAVETAPVPEPATMLLFGTGLAGMALFGRKRRKSVK